MKRYYIWFDSTYIRSHLSNKKTTNHWMHDRISAGETIFILLRFALFPQLVDKANDWRTKQITSLYHFYLSFFCFKPWKCQKLLKGLANDEKWRDCFSTCGYMNSSASGEVGASQNMAEYIWKWKMSFRKSQCWSNLEVLPHDQWLKRYCGGIRKADSRKY